MHTKNVHKDFHYYHEYVHLTQLGRNMKGWMGGGQLPPEIQVEENLARLNWVTSSSQDQHRPRTKGS